ncbi:MAG: M1 family metallopeptidase [Deltaproteobacteria bacterium]|nr:M1 family metallopeptidase [Deltaproteobacteria bacterium]
MRHLTLDLVVDFTTRTVAGTAELQLDRRDRTADLVLDVDGPVVERVVDCATKQPLRHTLGPRDPILGHALAIAPASDCVRIAYRTTPEAAAFLWVEPAGTAGKRQPMLFTQSQAIHARTWIPLQDTPGVRFTYDAAIRVEKVEAGVRPLMSATNPAAASPDGAWRFRMERAIPSYLMALAVGDFAFRPIGERTGVYAEPSLVDAAAAELAETEQMMAAAEALYGPYRWGRYDLLVLPPSFPYGGMENPRLTFLTPTVITGDRSLVSLIAHELAHSWSGNLVTNSTWSDLWLNEGTTTYVERRIMEALRGRAYADTLWYLGRRELEAELGELPQGARDPDSRLALDLDGTRDPDDVPAGAAYEKGSLFLRTLEHKLGRARLDAFLRARFDRLAFRSTDTRAFERDVAALAPAEADRREIAAWLHDPGVPAGAPPSTSARAAELERIAQGVARDGAVDASGWNTLDWMVFLGVLAAQPVSAAQLRALDARWKLTASPNAEIARRWFGIAIKADLTEAAPAVEQYLTTIGRRYLIKSVYDALLAAGGSWRALADAAFDRARLVYHPSTRDTIAKLLGK